MAGCALPDHIAAPMLSPGRWTVLVGLEKGMREAGAKDIVAQQCEVGSNIGRDAFMDFSWHERNPMTTERRCSKTSGQLKILQQDFGVAEDAAGYHVRSVAHYDSTNLPLWPAWPPAGNEK